MFKGNERGGDYSENGGGNGGEDTVIGSSIKIEGDLISNGGIIIEGEVVGSIKTDKALRVGERAKVVANIKASDAIVAGKVQGDVSVQGKLELAGTAQLNGNIQASNLVIASGAIFNGTCSMTENKNGVEAKKEETPE